MSNRGAGVAGGVRCGLGLAARWSGEACGAGGAGPSTGWRSDHAESRASGGCERCAGLEEKECGVLARDAWAAGGEACSAADGTAVARCSGACGWAGLGRSWALGIVPFDGLSAGDLTNFSSLVTRPADFGRRSLQKFVPVAANTEISCASLGSSLLAYYSFLMT